MLKKTMAVALALLLALIPCGLYASAEETATTTYKFSELEDKVNLCGRGNFTGKGFRADISGAGVEMAFNCEGDITLNLSWEYSAGMIGVILDNDYDGVNSIKIDAVGTRDVVIAQGLAKGEHIVRIMKLNQWSTNIMTLNSITVNGTLSAKPVNDRLKIEFYGDSISCGVGARCPSIEQLSPVGYYEDVLGSYNYNCCRELDAEMSLCAAGGYGYAYGYSTGETQTIFSLYDKSSFVDNTAWDFNKFDADIVVFELGTNDINWVKGKSMIVKDEFIETAVKNFVDKVRGYNPDCTIVLMGSTGGTFALKDKLNGPYIAMSATLDKVAKQYENCYFSGNLRVGGSGGGWHPNVEEAKKLGKRLADFIRNHIFDPIKYGDVTNDNAVNGKDVLRLKQYLADWDVEIDEFKTDVYFDYTYTAKDLLYLRRAIAGWDVVLGEPLIA